MRSLNAEQKVTFTDHHYIFSPPIRIWALADIGLNNDTATTAFAILENFKLISPYATIKIIQELLNDDN